MGPVVPFIPLIAKAGAGIFGGLMAKRAGANASKLTPDQQKAQTGAYGAASTLSKQGQSLYNMGVPAMQRQGQMLEPVSNYYDTLLRGDRQKMMGLTAPARRQIGEGYKGAEQNLVRSGVRGGARDQAKAEMARQQAGQIAGLTAGAQPFAAQGLGQVAEQYGQMGRFATQLGTGATAQAGNMYGALTDNAYRNRSYADQQAEKAGQNWGNVAGGIIDLIPGMPGGGAPRQPTPALPSGDQWGRPSTGTTGVWGRGVF